MKISRALSVFTHLIALVGFLSIFISGGVGVPTAIVFVLALTASFASELYGKNYYVGDRVSTLLAVLLVAYSAAGIMVFRFEPFRVVLDFLIFTQVLKLLGRKRMRDVVQIYVLSFFQFLAGAIITISFSFAFAFVLYIAAAIWALMIYEMRKAALDAGEPGRDGDPGVVTPMFLSTTFLLSFGIFLLAALIFVTVPRMRGNYLRTDFLRSGDLRSGFSDEVRLGRVGRIKLDSSPVMMVRILNRTVNNLPVPLYWRGIALDEFDGVSWKATGGGRYGGPETAPHARAPGQRGREGHLAQEVITESLDTDILFAANFPVSYGSVPGGRVAQVNDSYILPGRISGRIKYLAYSDVYTPPAGDLREAGGDYSEIELERYLQLPPLAPEVSELAREITSPDGNPYDKALAIKRYLLMNYGYTRTLEGGKGEYPLEEFLFDIKEGHCEYFSTAMVVLLREAGIPSRVVNGFIGGEWNEHGQFFLVRESDAHSWAEAYFPEYGWVTFDATPEGGMDAFASASFISSYVDYLRYRWSRYVIDFSQGDQVRLFNDIRDRWKWRQGKLTGPSGIFARPDGTVIAVIILSGIAVWILLTRTGLRSLFRPGKRGAPERAMVIYGNALKVLSRRGFTRPDYMTPREFSLYLKNSPYPGSGIMDELTDKYLYIRFGGGTDVREITALEALYGKLKSLKSKGPAPRRTP
ncbi:MAG: transglutaminase-like domain-containing protein [Candidatus Dadabacteria bacterium]|nr:transglutaminase-like domain-containing protein [Candidatus Dadabacteria bacterium]